VRDTHAADHHGSGENRENGDDGQDGPSPASSAVERGVLPPDPLMLAGPGRWSHAEGTKGHCTAVVRKSGQGVGARAITAVSLHYGVSTCGREFAIPDV